MALRRIVYFIMLYAILTYNVLYQTHDGMVMLIFFAAASISSAAMMLICGFNLKCGYEHNTVYVRRKNEFEVKYRIKNVAPFPVMSAQMLSGDKKMHSPLLSVDDVRLLCQKKLRWSTVAVTA